MNAKRFRFVCSHSIGITVIACAIIFGQAASWYFAPCYARSADASFRGLEINPGFGPGTEEVPLASSQIPCSPSREGPESTPLFAKGMTLQGRK